MINNFVNHNRKLHLVNCYAIKNAKVLYLGGDHHSIDGSIEQTKYFIYRLINLRKYE